MALDFSKVRNPNRTEASEATVELLRACHNNPEHIEQWNKYRATNGDWQPNTHNLGYQADLSKLTLFYVDSIGERQGIDLSNANLIGANLEYADLSGADLRRANLSEANLGHAELSGANLDRANLSAANLPDANLRGARLSNAILSGASVLKGNLSGAIIRSANFAGANLGEATLSRAILDRANLSEADLPKANLTGASLLDVNLSGANLRRANLKGARLSQANLSDANVTGVKYDRRSMRRKYQGIRVATCYGNAVFKRDAEDQDFIDTLKASLEDRRRSLDEKAKVPHGFSPMRRWNHSKNRWALRLFKAWGWIDYGRSLMRAGGIAFVLAMLFGCVFLFADLAGLRMLKYHDGTPDWWLTPFYYSIVTYTTLGFGDVTPCTKLGQVIVVVEVIFGYLTLGLLVSILANKVARRS